MAHRETNVSPAVCLAIAIVTTGIAALRAQDPTPPPVPQDPVVAVVGQQEIHESDLFAELNRQIPLVYYHQKVPEDQIESLRRRALAILIEKALIYQDAEVRKIEVTEAELRAELQRAVDSAGDEYKNLTKDKFEELLQQFRPLVRRRLLIERNEARFRDSVPKPDAAALAAVYEKLSTESPDMLLTPPSAHLLHIFVAVDPACTEAVFEEKNKRIDAAARQLADNKDFAAVAKEFSEDEFAAKGGDLGTVQQGRFKDRRVDEAAFALKAGETTPVLRSLYGFHLIRCLEVLPRRLHTIEETRPMLEQWFSTEHHRQRRELWLKEMRERSGVKVLVPELDSRQPMPAHAQEPAKEAGK